MKVFISWSGDCSKKIAAYLHDWIPSVLQTIHPYMSAENIDKGERWSQDIANQLQDTNYGIICVTPDNITAPWILFESGALSKSIQTARVSPVIFGLSPSDLSKSPLLQFQLTQFNKDDIKKLMIPINNSAPESEKIASELLLRSFERAWPELEEAVNAIDMPSSEPDSAGASGSPLKELDSKIVDSIEEILTNTRAQLKMLNSNSEFLTPAFLREAIQELKDREGRDKISPDHVAWSDIEENIILLKNSSIRSDNIEEFDDSIYEKKIHQLHMAIRFIYMKLYGRPLEGSFIGRSRAHRMRAELPISRQKHSE